MRVEYTGNITIVPGHFLGSQMRFTHIEDKHSEKKRSLRETYPLKESLCSLTVCGERGKNASNRDREMVLICSCS